MNHQVSELYRRGIVRPLDETAKNALLHLSVAGSIRCEWLPIPSDSDFETIWESGLFQAIGSTCRLSIADYEETLVEIDRIDQALTAVRTVLLRPGLDRSKTFAAALLALLIDAQACHMPVLFVL